MQALEIRKRNEVDFTTEQVSLIKATIAKDATDSELKLFLNQAKRTGLDPFSRQIYFVKDNKGKVTIITSIDGFRLIAERSGQYQGQTPAQWCGQDGIWKDVWLSSTPPAAARVGVYKTGFKDALYCVALMSEYKKTESWSPWAKFPTVMIAKVAESLALRKAFPNDMSGIYTEEEMPSAILGTPQQVAPTQVQAPKIIVEENVTQIEEILKDSGFEPNQPNMGKKEAAAERPRNPIFEREAPNALDYVVPFGRKYKGRKLSEIPRQELQSYLEWLINNATPGQSLSPQVVELKSAFNKFWGITEETQHEPPEMDLDQIFN